jgi:PAS domain S-box-containing protein
MLWNQQVGGSSVAFYVLGGAVAAALIALAGNKAAAFRRELADRDRALAALRADHTILLAVTEGTTDAIFVKDLEGRYLLANTAGARALGSTQKEIIGKRDIEFLPPEQASSIMNVDRWVMLAGEVRTSEETLTVSGSTRTYLTTRGPYRDEQGEILGLVGIARDITERKRAEEALSDLYDNAPDFSGSVDASTAIIQECNRTLTLATGYTKQEIVGRSVFEIYHPECLEKAHKAYQVFLDTGELRNAELQLRRKDGRAIDVSLNASAVRDKSGRIVYGRFVWRDITERKQAERHLRQLSARLLRLQEEERRRIARELHDTTAQNLAALRIALARVKEAGGSLHPAAKEALATSLELADECSLQIRTASYLLHPPLLDELGLASAVRVYAEGYTQRTGVQVEVAIPSDFGRLPTDVETTLFRIVQEALANVHRHSGSRIAELRVTRTPAEVVLQVQDHGRGLPPNLLEKDATGLGVGVAGMRERARQLGGALEIRSSARGTTVEITLPIEG